MQIGCDPKSDFTNTLRGGRFVPPYLTSCVAARGWRFNGILCVETGGPEPGVGCAGQMDRGYALDIIHYTGKMYDGASQGPVPQNVSGYNIWIAWQTDIDPHGRMALRNGT